MDDTPAKENPEKDFNKIDLSQLQGFSFGTQWTQDKSAPGDRRERSERPRREGGAPERRDRRAFRRPAGGEPGGDYAGGGGGVAAEPRERREFSGNRGPRREFRGPRREAGGEHGGPRGGYPERGPYDSPFYNVAFYPEDTSFNALAKTIRSSCRTIELFEIARTVVGKLDRFVVVLTRKSFDTAAAKPGDPAGESAPAAAAPAKAPLYLAVPDGMPFETEDAAVAHVLTNHLGRFFELAEVEVDPPKGNFLVINKCGVTGELLGPPNYHRYAHIVQQHHAAKLTRMPFEAFRNKIETVRDPEVVNQWLEKMKKATRYTWKQGAKPSSTPPPVAAEAATPAAEEAAAATAVQEDSTTPETVPALTFDSFEDARTHLLTHAREKVVRTVEHARFHGKLLETMPGGEIRRAIEGALERQRRFPLDTANALRGRLRREHFTIFKKGSKGISYVCAVKRKFRVPGQTFADSISSLITFIEASPMIRASALAEKFLGVVEPEAPKSEAPAPAATAAGAPAAEVPGNEDKPVESQGAEAAAAVSGTPAEPASVQPEVAEPTTPVPAAAGPVVTIEDRARITRMQGDLRWLVTEGYVTEFIDGRLFAPPPMVEARKKEVEGDENDLENFPEAPASNAPFETAPPENPPAQGDEQTAAESAAATEAPPPPATNESAETPEATTTGTAAEASATPREVPAPSSATPAAPEAEIRPEKPAVPEPEIVLAHPSGAPEDKTDKLPPTEPASQ